MLFGLVQIMPIFKGRTFGFKVSGWERILERRRGGRESDAIFEKKGGMGMAETIAIHLLVRGIHTPHFTPSPFPPSRPSLSPLQTPDPRGGHLPRFYDHDPGLPPLLPLPALGDRGRQYPWARHRGERGGGLLSVRFNLLGHIWLHYCQVRGERREGVGREGVEER